MNGSRLLHVGYVTASIAGSIAGSMDEYIKATGLSWDGRIIHDPLQKVRVAFLGSGDDNSALVELVEPAGSRSPVNQFLAAAAGLQHISMEVADLSKHIEASRAAGSTLAQVPLPAVAFGGRKIDWITTPAGPLIELLQSS